MQISAEQWRNKLLKKDLRHAADSKKNAIELAYKIIQDRSNSKAHTLRHDTAEAVLIGFWALHEVQWALNKNC